MKNVKLNQSTPAALRAGPTALSMGIEALASQLVEPRIDQAGNDSAKPTALLRGIEAMTAQMVQPRVDLLGHEPASQATASAAREEEMRAWHRSYHIERKAANDETALETHKKMWLELVT
ncbi:MAG: hypothetical protein ABI589_13070 [Burkholderiales bacterium]